MTKRFVLYCVLPPAALLVAFLAMADDVRASADAARLVAKAQATTDFAAAAEQYAAALKRLERRPFAADERYRLRLAVEHARARSGEIVGAIDALRGIHDEIAADASASPSVAREAAVQLAATRYHVAFLMRRDGAPRPEWLPLAESARQGFRRLAATGTDAGSRDAQLNFETILRFERADDEAARRLPLPEPSLASNLGLTRALPVPLQPPEMQGRDGRNTVNGNEPNPDRVDYDSLRPPYNGS